MTKSQFKALGSLIEYKNPQKVIASELKTRIDIHDRRHGAGASDEQTSWCDKPLKRSKTNIRPNMRRILRRESYSKTIWGTLDQGGDHRYCNIRSKFYIVDTENHKAVFVLALLLQYAFETHPLPLPPEPTREGSIPSWHLRLGVHGFWVAIIGNLQIYNEPTAYSSAQ